MSIVDDFSIATEADVASENAFLNVGLCTVKVGRLIQWVDGKPVEITRAQFDALALKGADGKVQKQVEYVFACNLSEFKPSLIKALGLSKGAEAADLLRGVNGKYVAVKDVPQVPKKGETTSKYNTISFVKVFASREEAYNFLNAGQPAPAVAVAATNYTAANAVVNGLPKYLTDAAATIKAAVGGGKPPAAVAAEWGTTAENIARVLAL